MAEEGREVGRLFHHNYHLAAGSGHLWSPPEGGQAGEWLESTFLLFFGSPSVLNL